MFIREMKSSICNLPHMEFVLSISITGMSLAMPHRGQSPNETEASTAGKPGMFVRTETHTTSLFQEEYIQIMT